MNEWFCNGIGILIIAMTTVTKPPIQNSLTANSSQLSVLSETLMDPSHVLSCDIDSLQSAVAELRRGQGTVQIEMATAAANLTGTNPTSGEKVSGWGSWADKYKIKQSAKVKVSKSYC